MKDLWGSKLNHFKVEAKVLCVYRLACNYWKHVNTSQTQQPGALTDRQAYPELHSLNSSTQDFVFAALFNYVKVCNQHLQVRHPCFRSCVARRLHAGLDSDCLSEREQ